MTICQIQALVARRYQLCVRELLSRRRATQLVRPRQIAMWLAQHITPCSLPEIGRAFDRDHTTIAHGVGKVDDLMRADRVFAETVLALMDELSPAATAEFRAARRIAA
jgi:chromosomal replication initiator protein